MGNKRRKRMVVDPNTGEVTEYIEFRDNDTLITKEQKEFLENKAKKYSDKTDFVWVKFVYNTDFYKLISPENLTRLMYFASFCGKENYVMQDIDLKSVLHINSNQVKTFKDEFFGQAIIQDGCRLYLCNELFSKGKISKSPNNYARLYTETTRLLYLNCTSTSEHAYLSYFFRMIPFVNRQSNILCTNQEEQDINHIAYMNVTEFFNLINRTHHSRIKQKLLSYRINGELAIGFFNTIDRLDYRGKYALINPILFYGGDKTKNSYKVIQKLFIDEKEERTSHDILH